MGCTSSKLDGEETVSRCRERRRLMKQAVKSRHLFAAAHSEYLRHLHLTASALSEFSAGEPFSVAGQAPPVVLLRRSISSASGHQPNSPPHVSAGNKSQSFRHNPSFPANSAEIYAGRVKPMSVLDSTDSSPSARNDATAGKPKPTSFPTGSYRHGAGETKPMSPMSFRDLSADPRLRCGEHSPTGNSKSASFSNHSLRSGNNLTAGNLGQNPTSRKFSPDDPFRSGHYPPGGSLPRKVKTSSFCESSPDPSVRSNDYPQAGIMAAKLKPGSFRSSPPHLSHYSAQYPPAADSNFRVGRRDSMYSDTSASQSSYSVWNWENFYPPSPPGSDFYRQHEKAAAAEREGGDLVSGEREEIHCSDWGDEYLSRNSSNSCSDEDRRSQEDDTEHQESKLESWVPTESAANLRSGNDDDVGVSSMTWHGSEGELKMVRRHKDFKEITAAIEECFVKAAEAGKEVAELLETDRQQFDRSSFPQITKTVYHSSNILRNLSSSWTSKPPLAIKYSVHTASLMEPGTRKSHCSTLEQLLEWEKKLHEEVKAREAAKIEHEKKLQSLQSQEYRGEKDIKLDKTKASINKLQSVIMVSSQAVGTTSSAINMVRDNELCPQLLDLCKGLMKMWKSMYHFHDMQNNIIQQVRGLINLSSSPESTPDLHRQYTHQLQIAVSGWHSSFSSLNKHHQDYIHALHSWLRLTLQDLPDSLATTANTETASRAYSLCDHWRQAVDRLPVTVASEAIKSFVTVVQAISMQQSEELRCRRQSEAAAKELEKKNAALRAIEKKFYGTLGAYSLTGIDIPGIGSDPSRIDARDPLAEKRALVVVCRRKAEEEMAKHAKAVQVTREMTLNNIQTGLPGVFQAITGFSGVCSEAFEAVYNHAVAVR